jgi:hypothetical protein
LHFVNHTPTPINGNSRRTKWRRSSNCIREEEEEQYKE